VNFAQIRSAVPEIFDVHKKNFKKTNIQKVTDSAKTEPYLRAVKCYNETVTYSGLIVFQNSVVKQNKIKTIISVSTKKRPPPKYNGLVFEILGKHH